MDRSDDFQQRPLRVDEDTPGAPIEKMAGGRRRAPAVLPMRQQAGRMPPQALDVERTVLAAVLTDAEACARATALLRPEVFYEPRHAAVFAAVEAVFASGSAVDIITVRAELERRGEARLGGPYLAEISTRWGDPANVEYHGRILQEKAMVRRLITALTGIVGRAFDPAEDPFDLVDAAAQSVTSIAFDVGAARADTHVRHAVAEALLRTDEWRAGESTEFAPSGFYSLDRTTGGLPVGELTTLAAMTGAGKTSLLAQSVRAVALAEMAAVRRGKREVPRPIVVFSAEMSREQIVHRMAAGMTGLNLRVLRAGKADPAEYDAFDRALGQIATFPLHVDDEPQPSFTHIAARLTQVAIPAGGEIAYVGVDYDEKLQTEGQTEELRVSAIAQGLKNTAKRFRCPVLALSQYSRSANHREFPSNDWLRYSGKKEHESAQIIHWMYPHYWAEKGFADDSIKGYDPGRPERGRLVVTKNRFGPTGHIALDFHPTTTSFIDPLEPSSP